MGEPASRIRSTSRPSGRSMPTSTSPWRAHRPKCFTSSSNPSLEWATEARPPILPVGSTTQTSSDSAAQSMPTNIRPPFCRGAVPVAEARGGSLLPGARGASSHGRSALPEAGGGGGIRLALEGRWHLAFPPPVTEIPRACTLRTVEPWNLTQQGWSSNGRGDRGSGGQAHGPADAATRLAPGRRSRMSGRRGSPRRAGGPRAASRGAVLKEFVNRLPLIGVHSGLSQLDAAILWQIRVPRVVLGGLVGAMLAMAGASYQGVFRNPLADPYLLGVAAGAGLGATLAVAYLPGRAGWPADPLPLTAFAGALVAVAATYVLGRSGIRSRNTATLILAGVAVAAFFTAAQTYAQQQHADTLREVYAWILGVLGTAAWRQVALILPYVAASGLALLLHRRLLDVMSLGDEEADSLGIRATRVRLTVVIIATLGTAAAVAVSGLIGFVGIIVPHTVRLLAGSSYRRILPLSVIFGAAFLILADLIARTALSPAEIPIGVITAFVGAPFFLLVLRRTRRLS